MPRSLGMMERQTFCVLTGQQFPRQPYRSIVVLARRLLELNRLRAGLIGAASTNATQIEAYAGAIAVECRDWGIETSLVGDRLIMRIAGHAVELDYRLHVDRDAGEKLS